MGTKKPKKSPLTTVVDLVERLMKAARDLDDLAMPALEAANDLMAEAAVKAAFERIDPNERLADTIRHHARMEEAFDHATSLSKDMRAAADAIDPR